MDVLDRLILRDEQWERISQHIIGNDRTRGSSGRDNRMFVEAVLWIVRTGSPWRDLPDDPDFEYLIVDSTIIRADQHAAGAKRGLKIKPLSAPAAV